MPPEDASHGDLRHLIAEMVEPAWYKSRYPDVVVGDRDPRAHFEEFGIPEQRDPNHCFDTAWYRRRYPEVAASGLDPLSHYVRLGAAALFDPHPRFDAAWYVRQHPDAAANPVLYHLRTGRVRGYATQQPIEIRDHLPSDHALPATPPGVFVDIVVPPFSSLAEATHCLAPVLSDRNFPLARIIVFDDPTSDAAVSAWLDELASEGQIHLIRDRRRMSFARCARRGIEAAETHDVVLLHRDSRISPDSLRRLAGHAWAAPRIATVSPLSDHASAAGNGLSTFNHPASIVEACCRTINAGRSVQ
ncbi:MAG TPA: glycosyltransferase, partial [Rhodopila sp.]